MSKLTKLIRSKHPGAYDDLNDADLESKVLAKYPEYKDLAVPDSDEKPKMTGEHQTVIGDRPDSPQEIAANKLTDIPEGPPNPTQFEGPGLLKQAWDWSSKPLTDAPSRLGHYIAEQSRKSPEPVDERMSGQGGFRDFLAKTKAQMRGFGEGVIEGIGDTASGFTSPQNLVMMGATMGSGALAKRGVTTGVGALNAIGRAASVPMAVHGGMQVADPHTSLKEKAFGVTELAGGVAGAFHHTPEIKPRVNPAIAEAAKRPGTNFTEAQWAKETELNPFVRMTPTEVSQMSKNVGPEDTGPVYAEMRRRGLNPADSVEPRKPYSDHDPNYVTPTQETPHNPMEHLNDAKLIQLRESAGNDPTVINQVYGEMQRRGINPAELSREMPPTPQQFGPQLEGPLPDISGMKARVGEIADRAIGKVPEPTVIPEPPTNPFKEKLNSMQVVDDTGPTAAIGEPVQQSLGLTRPAPKNKLSVENPKELGDKFGLQMDPSTKLPTEAPDEDIPLFQKRIGNGQPEVLRPDQYIKTNAERIEAGEKVPDYNEVAENGHVWVDNLYGKGMGGYADKTSLAFIEDTNRMKRNKSTSDDEPSFARSEQGGIKIGQNIKRSAAEVTTGYSQPLEGVMVREGMQNAMDAVRHLKENGKIHIKVNKEGMEITDNGKGMNRKQLETVFSDLYESGKTGEEGSTGGKGIGKATYMLGGKHFEAETVTQVGNKKIKFTLGGTPDEFSEHVPINEVEVPPDTPTGTVIRTKFLPNQQTYYAHQMMDKVINGTRGIKAQVTVNKYGQDLPATTFQHGTNEKTIGKATFDDNQVKVSVPHDAKQGDRQYIEVDYLNNGMYQFSRSHYLSDVTPNMPEKLLVDIHPLVEEGTPKYPFPTQRESIKDSLHEQIEKFINDKLAFPEQRTRQTKLAELYNSMKPIPDTNTRRPGVLYDPGDRLTKPESRAVKSSVVVKHLTEYIDNTIENILQASKQPTWSERLENTGIVLDPGMYGVHIPNPSTKKSSILLNPFQHMLDAKNPADAALNMVVTAMHEVAHIGSNFDTGKSGNIDVASINDPRVGKYLSSYLNQVKNHGGLDQGHNMAFVKRLGEIYGDYGPEQAFESADLIHSEITDEHGGYSPEIQKLLSIYQESRGRSAVTEDFLSGTGDKQKSTPTGEGAIPGDNKADGDGIASKFANYQIGQKINVRSNQATPQTVKLAMQNGFTFDGVTDEGHFRFVKTNKGAPAHEFESIVGNTRPRIGGLTNVKASNPYLEAFNFPRTAMAALDFSAPMRQGIGLIHKEAFWTSFDDMFKAWGSEKGFDAVQKSISDQPLFKKRVGRNGKLMPSFAEEAGLKLTDLLDSREESMLSSWADILPGVRRSNRAYTAFLNKLRSDTFSSLIETGKVFGADGTVNIPLARGLADFVNNATGRGSLKFGSGRIKLDLESSAEVLGSMFFSPRLVASRMQMMNPQNYIMGPKMVRMEYLKSAFAIAAASGTVLTLGELAGHFNRNISVSKDPASADFMKLKIGETRLDPNAGFQQYVVALQRLMPHLKTMGLDLDKLTGIHELDIGGRMKSSTTNREYDLGNPPYGKSTRWTVAGRFTRGKINPVFGFAASLMDAQRELSGKKMNFTAWNPVGNTIFAPHEKNLLDNSIVQRFVPMLLEDMYEIGSMDKTHLPLAIPAAFGMGVQQYGDE